MTAGWTDSFDDFKLIAQQLHDLGDTVVALGEMHGVIKDSDDGTPTDGERRDGLPRRKDR